MIRFQKFAKNCSKNSAIAVDILLLFYIKKYDRSYSGNSQVKNFLVSYSTFQKNLKIQLSKNLTQKFMSEISRLAKNGKQTF